MTTVQTRRAGRGAAQKKTAHRARRAQAAPLRELWLAGLGAAAATGEAASDVVDLLVEKGRTAEPRVAAAAARALAAARARAGEVADELGERAQDALRETLDRLGVERRPRSKNLLHRLGDLAEAIL
jgi:polyhydroxyalkanoate synthesis regulator phasin